MTHNDALTDRPSAPWWAKLTGKKQTVIPVVRLQGTIEASQRPNRINIAVTGPLLKKAFAVKRAPAVALIVNSPGGSPVQSRLVAKYIRDLAELHDKKVLVFVEDVAGSGGYFIATAGDEIIADPSSIVGSIGVIMSTFGFADAIARLGIERRVYTAGKNKSTLDPFQPEKKADVARIKQLGADVHEVFIDWVKSRRGDKLKTDYDLFTGEFWTAKRALEFGLVDSLGDMHAVLRQRYGDKVRLMPIAASRGLFSLKLPFVDTGAGGVSILVDDVIAAIEDRLLWSRFGR
ncbi:MAG: S49 family peptidase [Alphaproteobacteria bacterium]|nr:S49 family peptidase [Alphaproteobacteria bacterium]